MGGTHSCALHLPKPVLQGAPGGAPHHASQAQAQACTCMGTNSTRKPSASRRVKDSLQDVSRTQPLDRRSSLLLLRGEAHRQLQPHRRHCRDVARTAGAGAGWSAGMGRILAVRARGPVHVMGVSNGLPLVPSSRSGSYNPPGEEAQHYNRELSQAHKPAHQPTAGPPWLTGEDTTSGP
jgi:hypothetical protein